MAFTKAPVSDTHNTVRIPSLGSSFLMTGTSKFPYTLSYYNCFPLKERQHARDPKYRVSKREPYKVAHTVTTNSSTDHWGPVVVSTADTGEVYFGKGNTIYKVVYNSGSPIISTITTDSGAGYYSGTEALQADGSNCYVFLVNGGKIIKWDSAGTVTTATPSQGLDCLKGLVFLNGYLFALGNTNSFIYNSDPGNDFLTWNTTNFTNAEIFPDTSIAIAKHKNHLVVFGKQSIEFFYDAAIEIGSPLTRQQSYTSQVGLSSANVGSIQTCIAEIGDDLYFIGREKNSSRALYRIRDFKVEQIESQYIAAALNDNEAGADVFGVETIYVNNNPMIKVIMSNTSNFEVPVYYPENDTWCLFSGTDLGQGDYRIGTMFTNSRWSADGNNQTGAGYFFYRNETTPTTVEIRTSDSTWTNSLTAYYTSEVIDFGINFWKHIARVDVIGDYGVNSITLKYYPSASYTTAVTCSPVQSPSTNGNFNNVSWYNLGRYRRFALQLEMAGAGPALHEAFEVTYNVGAA